MPLLPIHCCLSIQTFKCIPTSILKSSIYPGPPSPSAHCFLFPPSLGKQALFSCQAFLTSAVSCNFLPYPPNIVHLSPIFAQFVPDKELPSYIVMSFSVVSFPVQLPFPQLLICWNLLSSLNKLHGNCIMSFVLHRQELHMFLVSYNIEQY